MGLEGSVYSRQHEGRQQQPDAVGDVAHHHKQRRSQHLDAVAEATLKQLIHSQQLTAKVRWDEQDRNHNSAQHVPQYELDKLKIAALRKSDSRN